MLTYFNTATAAGTVDSPGPAAVPRDATAERGRGWGGCGEGGGGSSPRAAFQRFVFLCFLLPPPPLAHAQRGPEQRHAVQVVVVGHAELRGGGGRGGARRRASTAPYGHPGAQPAAARLPGRQGEASPPARAEGAWIDAHGRVAHMYHVSRVYTCLYTGKAKHTKARMHTHTHTHTQTHYIYAHSRSKAKTFHRPMFLVVFLGRKQLASH